jgi:hypothetical protein
MTKYVRMSPRFLVVKDFTFEVGKGGYLVCRSTRSARRLGDIAQLAVDVKTEIPAFDCGGAPGCS